MLDIVEKLRDPTYTTWRLCHSAAREIERLREGIREYACTGTDEPCGCYRLLSQEKSEIERLQAALLAAKRSHETRDDCWYSCPKSEEGCCNDATPKDYCTCGADEHNAAIDAALGVEQKASGE